MINLNKNFDFKFTINVLDFINKNKIYCEVKKYKKDSYVALRGDKVNFIMIIKSGSVSAEMLKEDGTVQVVEILEENNVLAPAFVYGIMNVLPVDIRAVSNVEILFIKKDIFLKLLCNNEDLLKSFLNSLSSRVQFLSAKLRNSFEKKTIHEKFRNYVELNAVDNKIIIKNINTLAEEFSVTRPYLSKILSQYIKDGKIIKDKKEYTILAEFYK